MTKPFTAALAAILLAGAALADAPAPVRPPVPAEAKAEGAAKPVDGAPKEAKDARAAKKPAKKAAAGQKDAPCEPVKPCPIE
jgi:hypothetical protein